MTPATGYKLQAAGTACSRPWAVAVPAACSLKPAARRCGFVLLMVLVVLVLAGTVLAATARRSGREALVAAGEMEDLQVAWALRSARAVGQASAETWLAEEAAESRRRDADSPPVRAARTVRLGTMEVTIVVTDEEAKASANLLAARGGLEGLASSLRRLMSPCRTAARIELAPATPRAETISAWPRLYQSYAQLYPDNRAADLLGGAAGGSEGLGEADAPGVADAVTCWGSGRVNVRRASREVLRQTLAGLATEEEIDRLIRYRQEVPGGSAQEAVAQLDLEDEQRAQALARALTDVSRCHGLWLTARGSTRSWTELHVRQEGDAENDSGQWSFQW